MSEADGHAVMQKLSACIVLLKVLLALAVVASVIGVAAITTFLSYRRAATARLDQYQEAIDEMREIVDLLKRHSEVVREARNDTKQALCDVKTETAKATAVANSVQTTVEELRQTVASTPIVVSPEHPIPVTLVEPAK